MMISISASLSTWFTPTVLFCILNLTVAIIFLTSRKKQPDKHHQLGVEPPQLFRVPSLLERAKSFNFSFRRSDQSYATYPADSQVEEERNVEGSHHIVRSKSETGVEDPAPVKTVKKSVSEKEVPSVAAEDVDGRRVATVRERKGKWAPTRRFGEDEAVDEKAEDFIKRFRQQLKLQRLDSILRYKEMLNRGI